MARRRRTSSRPTCRDCPAEITWFRHADTGRWRTFNPRPVDGRTHSHGAYPVWGGRAWDPDILAAEISAQRGCTPDEAASEVADLPWHQHHACEHAPQLDPEGAAP